MTHKLRFFCSLLFFALFSNNLLPAQSISVSSDSSSVSSSAPTEQRGVWLATVAGLDWPRPSSPYFERREILIENITELAQIGCNTLYFQVVSQMDAMYSSDILPWSRRLSGIEDLLPYFDPLSLAVKVAHDNNMAIHAWLNPFRVCNSDSLANRSLSGVRYAHPEWVQTYMGKEYLDPGNPEVIEFVCSIAREILTKYDVDGIHIDDFFYPSDLQRDKRSPSEPGAWDDSILFARYGGGMSLDEWRFSNIDNLVSQLHKTVHATKPGAVFGVSPQGRIINTCAIYADPRHWVAQGSVDYLIPQLYWSMDRGDAAAFPVALKEWVDICAELPLYVGIAAYKHDPNYYKYKREAGFKDVTEFSKQINYLRSIPQTNGHVWFRTLDLLEKEDLRNLIVSEIYKQ